MNITQQLCCPGAAENQDYIRLGEDIAMVVDGSTPLVKDPRVPEVREMLLRHRRRMNRPGGYWIAGFAPEAARHGTHRVYRREELSRVVLFSDGFSGQREALLGAEEPCLQELYRQLRQREAADSRCNRYPRLKPGDDVSGIVAVF